MKIKNLGIGIHGKKYSGKSEISLLLEKLIDDWDTQKNKLKPSVNIIQLAFADSVKEISCDLMPNNFLKEKMSYVSSNQKEIIIEEINKSPREIWKIVGEIGRTIHSDLWVNKVLNKISDYLLSISEKYIFLIDDVRRENEFQALKNKNFLLLRVVGSNDSQDQHPTETDLDCLTDDHFDAVIHNENKNPEYLKLQVEEIFRDLIEPKLNQMLEICSKCHKSLEVGNSYMRILCRSCFQSRAAEMD